MKVIGIQSYEDALKVKEKELKENSKQIALPKAMLSNPFTVNIYNKM